MYDDEWYEILRRSFSFPHADDDELDRKFQAYVERYGAQHVARSVAGEAMKFGMEQASLALA